MNLIATTLILTEQLLIIAGVGVTVAVWGAFALRSPLRQAALPPGAQLRRLRVKGSYEPDELHLEAGQPTRLLVRREETAPCSERIVFPSFGLSFDLPAYTEVALDLPPAEPGEYRFCCEMDMLEGRLVVERALASSATRQALAA